MKAWIAMDKKGSLYVHIEKKPHKVYFENNEWWENEDFRLFDIEEKDLPEGINPQWEDEEPIEIELKIVKKSK